MADTVDLTPPHSLDAEESVLASIMVDPECWFRVREIIGPKDFYDERNRWCFEACDALARSGGINQVTLAEELKRQNRIEEIGGMAYLSHVISLLPTSVHAEYYAEIVRRMAMMRRLIATSERIKAIGYDPKVDPEEAMAKSLEMLVSLRGQVSDDHQLTPMNEVLNQHFEEIYYWLHNRGRLRGISTGFNDLDRVLDGLVSGNLILVASRPGMGKTTFLNRIADNVAARGVNTAYFSLEQNSKAILERVVLARCRLNRYEVRVSGGLTETSMEAFQDQSASVGQLPLWIDDTAGITTQQVQSRLLALQAQHRVGLMLFDYVNMAGDSSKFENEDLRITNIVRRLRDIGKTCNVPVVAAAQLNRKVDERANKHPVLSDLRYGGEEPPDIVLMLYRHDYYVEQGMLDPDPEQRNILEVYIAKHREGPTGRIKLYCDEKTGWIQDDPRQRMKVDDSS